MTFLGLSQTGLLALAASVVLATTLLYILKLRRRAVSVPFSPVWHRVLGDKDSTQLFSQLKRWLSLLLQLVLALLLVFAVADPRLTEQWLDGRNVVVLVDVSASMKASDVNPSRLGVAKQKVSSLIDSLSGRDRMLIAELGVSPRPLSTMTDDVTVLATALKTLQAKDTGADLARGLFFALDSLRGASKPEIILVSDGAFEDVQNLGQRLNFGETKFSFIPLGDGGDNAAITAFSVRRYPLDRSRYEVMLEVANFSDAPREVELTLLGDGDVVDVSRFNLAAGERLPRFYQDLAGAGRTLEARIQMLSGSDKLTADDRAYALLPERRRVHVLLVTPGNTYVEATLLLDEYLDVEVISPGTPLPKGPFDVTILDQVAPELRPEHGAALYLNPPEAGGPLKYAKSLSDFGFDSWDRQSPILRWIAPENIQVSRGHSFEVVRGDRIVGASELGPILVSGERHGKRFVALSFDPRDSDFVLRVGWPLFVLNTINYFAEEDSRYLSSFRTGELWHVPVPPSVDAVELVYPDQQRLKLSPKDGVVSLFGEQAGFYAVEARPGEALGGFAANLNNPFESHLEVVRELRVGSVLAASVTGFAPGVRRELWWYLLAAAVGLSCLEWFAYHRRMTV